MKINITNGYIIDSDNNLVKTDNGITCGCKDPEMKLVAHLDGAKSYTYTYKCKCGNQISLTRNRDKDDPLYMEDEDD